MADAWQAPNLFLYVEGPNGGQLEGDSMDQSHLDEIQVTSIDVTASAEKSGGAGSWRSTLAPITMTLIVSTASPSLAAACWSGTTFKRFIVSVRKPGESSKTPDYMQWCFLKVQVTEHTIKIADEKPEETIKFSYQQIEFYYARQGHTGKYVQDLSRMWSLDKNSDKGLTAMLPFTP